MGSCHEGYPCMPTFYHEFGVDKVHIDYFMMTNNTFLVKSNTKVLCEDDNIAPINGSDYVPVVTEHVIKVGDVTSYEVFYQL